MVVMEEMQQPVCTYQARMNNVCFGPDISLSLVQVEERRRWKGDPQALWKTHLTVHLNREEGLQAMGNSRGEDNVMSLHNLHSLNQ